MARSFTRFILFALVATAIANVGVSAKRKPSALPAFPAAPAGSIVGDADIMPGPLNNKTSGMARLVLVPGGNHTIYVSLSGVMAGVTMAHVHVKLGNATSGPVRLGVLPALSNPATIAPPLTFAGQVQYTVRFTGANLRTWFTDATDATDAETQFLGLLQTDKLYFNVHTLANPGGEVRGEFGCVRQCKPVKA